jgi:uncharacterized protein (TIGR04255 family)
MPRELPEFDRPPVNEVVFGIQFQPLKALRAAHLGLFWNRIRDRYPNTEEQVEVAHLVEKFDALPTRQSEGDLLVEVATPSVIPRCWYLDESRLQLTQVQQDRFLRNWRQIEGKEAYPRFEVLFERFREEWHGFLEFLDEERIGNPTLDQCELTYINHIAQGEGWTGPSELSKVVSVWAGHRSNAFLPEPELVNWTTSYRLPNQYGRLHVRMRQAIRNRDRRPIIVLDLTARGAPNSQYWEDVSAWFDLAHEWIVRGFAELTTPEMHRIWGRTK